LSQHSRSPHIDNNSDIDTKSPCATSTTTSTAISTTNTTSAAKTSTTSTSPNDDDDGWELIEDKDEEEEKEEKEEEEVTDKPKEPANSNTKLSKDVVINVEEGPLSTDSLSNNHDNTNNHNHNKATDDMPEPDKPLSMEDFFVNCTLCKDPFPDMYIKRINEKPFCDKCYSKVAAAAQARRLKQLQTQEVALSPQLAQPVSHRAQPRVRGQPQQQHYQQPHYEEQQFQVQEQKQETNECFACHQMFEISTLIALQNKMFCAHCYAQIIQKAKNKGILNKILV